MTSLKKDEVWYILVDTHSLHMWPMMLCLYDKKRCIWKFFYFIISTLLKPFFLCVWRPSKKHSEWPNMQRRRVFFKGEGVHDSGQLGFIFWYLCSSLIMSSAVWWRQSTLWLMGNDSIPHTSRLSLHSQVCKSCLICPKQSQEETTVLMPLKSGH